jgi:hypothetical protein
MAVATIKEKNECAKTRPISNPYEKWESADGSWTWLVLKKYQKPSLEAANPNAVWFCAVTSPFTFGTTDYGDTYVHEIKRYGHKVA